MGARRGHVRRSDRGPAVTAALAAAIPAMLLLAAEALSVVTPPRWLP